MTDIKFMKDRIESWTKLKNDADSLREIYALAREEADETIEADLKTSFEDLRIRFDRYAVVELLSGEADKSCAFLSIHAGSGGTEACDWA